LIIIGKFRRKFFPIIIRVEYFLSGFDTAFKNNIVVTLAMLLRLINCRFIIIIIKIRWKATITSTNFLYIRCLFLLHNNNRQTCRHKNIQENWKM